MDMAVDCKPGEAYNQVVEVNVKVEESGENNVHNNAFYTEETLLKTESEAQRDCNQLSARHWIIRNTRTMNIVLLRVVGVHEDGISELRTIPFKGGGDDTNMGTEIGHIRGINATQDNLTTTHWFLACIGHEVCSLDANMEMDTEMGKEGKRVDAEMNTETGQEGKRVETQGLMGSAAHSDTGAAHWDVLDGIQDLLFVGSGAVKLCAAHWKKPECDAPMVGATHRASDRVVCLVSLLDF